MSSSTVYDDVHRTMESDKPELLIPVVDEAFNENFTGEEEIVRDDNTHFLEQQDGRAKKRITDSCVTIRSKEKVRRYHIENQSSPDSSMLIRMFEYDTQIALEHGELEKNMLTVDMPKAAVIYLRSTKNTPDVLQTRINTMSGPVTYDIPILKVQNYSIEEIFEKKLFFFIPFHIFIYENKFNVYNNTKEGVAWLQGRYRDIGERLEKATTAGEIDEYTRQCILTMTRKVVEHIAADYENIRKGIGEVMGGKVLDYEAKNIYNAGRSEGISFGKVQGAIDTCISLIKAGVITMAAAAEQLKMPEAEIEKYIIEDKN